MFYHSSFVLYDNITSVVNTPFFSYFSPWVWKITNPAYPDIKSISESYHLNSRPYCAAKVVIRRNNHSCYRMKKRLDWRTRKNAALAAKAGFNYSTHVFLSSDCITAYDIFLFQKHSEQILTHFLMVYNRRPKSSFRNIIVGS